MNASYVDRTSPADVSTVTASYNRLRRRGPTSTSTSINNHQANGNAIDISLVEGCYHTSPGMWLQQEEAYYRAATNGGKTDNVAVGGGAGDAMPPPPPPTRNNRVDGKYYYDNPMSTTEV